MRKFELCVDIEPNRRFLIPDLLLKVEEPYTGNWPNTLGFQYHYETYLKSIFTRFVVRMYPFIYKKTWWKNGLVLEHEGSKALVKFDASNKKVVINIDGDVIKKRQYLLAIIRKEFKEIHGNFAVLPFKEFAAHPKIKVKNDAGEDTEFLRDYDELIKAEEDGETEIYAKELRRKVSISEWLDGIEEDRYRKMKYEPEDNSALIRASAELTKLKNDKEKLDSIKQRLDERADVWATVIRWSIGLFLLFCNSYFIYWCVKNLDWIKVNWTTVEIVLGLSPIVLPTLLIIIFLFRKETFSHEFAVNLIEVKVQKFLYGKRNFEFDRYLTICLKMKEKEDEVQILGK